LFLRYSDILAENRNFFIPLQKLEWGGYSAAVKKMR